MITTRSRETYEGGWRIVLYDADEGGHCTSHLTPSSFDAVIDEAYQQREKEIVRLQESLFKNEISPLAFFMQLSRMTVEDAAARMRLRKSTVRSHLTPSGFDRMGVETLRRYARLFDIAVGEFFQFTHLDGELSVELSRSEGGLVQRVRVFQASKGAGAVDGG